MDTEWSVETTPSAQRERDELPDAIREEVLDAVLELSDDPFPSDSIELAGHGDFRRIKAYRSQYCIVYRISATQGKVIIWRVRPRATAYHGF